MEGRWEAVVAAAAAAAVLLLLRRWVHCVYFPLALSFRWIESGAEIESTKSVQHIKCSSKINQKKGEKQKHTNRFQTYLRCLASSIDMTSSTAV